ncbi:MAG: 3-carboxy-cis,cis-muconate cycloisomerase [Acidobacteriaceae bacterium]|nr:3-carboxy-cis,cis-muconate cycloisomerase [Acidobacteriaceae bacterium]
MALFDPLFGWHEVDELFTDHATVQRMLDFEAALARAEARTGLIPASVVEPIVCNCRAHFFDVATLAKSGARAGNVAIPLVKELTARVEASHRDAAGFVHWGATSQDVIDTATVLQLREALKLIERELGRLFDTLCDLAERHRSTPIAGRTWMQHAVPIVLGLKIAGWADALGRHAERVTRSREQVAVLQFGGAAGTLASLGKQGIGVARALASELDLALPAMPWHAHRDRLVEAATVLALLTGTLSKIARDLSLLSQTELSEILEPSGEGRGASSTMPQKRNPVTAAAVLAAATRVPGLVSTLLSAMVQENERGLGGWHAEWETLPEVVRLTAGAVHHLADTVVDVQICPDRMQYNLDATSGLIFAEAITMALARFLGKSQAHAIIESCARQATLDRQHLRDVVHKDARVTAHLSPPQIDALFDPLSYAGVASEFIDRVIARRSAKD